MSALSRKQLLLSQDSISRLHEWSDRYDLSEAELVRRAIQNYDPEHERAQSDSAEHEKAAEAMLEFMAKALKSAMNDVDAANARVRETLAGLDDPAKRKAIDQEVRQEVAESPGWMDEVADLLVTENEDAA
ncbi:hypothetical protein SAMN04488490_0903 [Marinobacter sp. LV10R510-11A]|uniref:hypothetical protein n=1 Tax=Marinobacter sp. LV10R510-11A TaxID=1415568 RepID=UPI000BB8175A|nr:hypothetical protein [Marinobacter sp. LV10R510-11A]SOB75328.1 hypothetical protein SAMN04488490_0903 [Marinobacter sp. LV10R510-11A]